MLTKIELINFKSYKKAILPLAPLTMLIGANASGKSNAIEGLRLLSWLAQGNRLSSIQSAVQESKQLMRGRIQDLGYHALSRFSLSCHGHAKRTQSLKISLEIKTDDTLHLADEIMDDLLSSSYLPLYQVVRQATGMGTDMQGEYNNFARGGHKPKISLPVRLDFTYL